MPSLMNNNLTSLDEDFAYLGLKTPKFLSEDKKPVNKVASAVKNKLAELKESKVEKGEKFNKSASGKAIEKKKALRAKRPVAQMESVEDLIANIADQPRKEALRAYCNMSKLGDRLHSGFTLFAESSNDYELGKIARGFELLSENNALIAKKLNEGHNASDFAEQCIADMNFLIDGLKLFKEITETINEVPSDSHETDEEGKRKFMLDVDGGEESDMEENDEEGEDEEGESEDEPSEDDGDGESEDGEENGDEDEDEMHEDDNSGEGEDGEEEGDDTHVEPDGDEDGEGEDGDDDGLPPWLRKKAQKAESRNFLGK